MYQLNFELSKLSLLFIRSLDFDGAASRSRLLSYERENRQKT
jgi:hypothetical protein